MKFIKKLSLIMALMTAFALFFTVTAPFASAEGEPSVSIDFCNLSFRDNVCIKYAVRADNIDSPEENVKLLIWTSPDGVYAPGTQNAELTTVGTQQINGETYHVFDYTKLAAKQMTDVVYARACATVNGETVVSEVNKYSILQYAYNKLGKTATATEDETLVEMLTQMLKYGAAAQKTFNYHTERLATADYYQVKLEGGLLEDGCARGLYLEGTELLLTAPTGNAEEKSFLCWTDGNGAEIAKTPSFTLSVPAANDVYTATYGGFDGSEGLSYSDNGDGTCTVIGMGDCSDSELIIPSVSPSGAKVTAIAESAFSGEKGITSVVIPDSVLSVGKGAFNGCSNITEMTIPFVGAKAGTTAADTDQYPFGYIFGSTRYTGGSSTKQFYYGSSLTDTTSMTCYIPSKLKSVTVTGGEILYGAFYNCQKIENITLYEGLETVGDSAFAYCMSLSEMTLPQSLIRIGNGAFNLCGSLTGITVPDKVTFIGDDAFAGCMSLVDVKLGCSVINIGQRAFELCGFANIDLPDSVNSIGLGAFGLCENLTEIKLPKNAESIDGEKLFYECVKLKSVDLGGMTEIGIGQFYGCTSLESVTLSDSITSVGDHAFFGCESLKSVTLGSGVRSIGIYAFSDCIALESIIIPESVSTVGYCAFYGCDSISSIEFKRTDGWYRTMMVTDTSGEAVNLSDFAVNAASMKANSEFYYLKRQ